MILNGPPAVIKLGDFRFILVRPKFYHPMVGKTKPRRLCGVRPTIVGYSSEFFIERNSVSKPLLVLTDGGGSVTLTRPPQHPF